VVRSKLGRLPLTAVLGAMSLRTVTAVVVRRDVSKIGHLGTGDLALHIRTCADLAKAEPPTSAPTKLSTVVLLMATAGAASGSGHAVRVVG
jgi:hypothetical protein